MRLRAALLPCGLMMMLTPVTATAADMPPAMPKDKVFVGPDFGKGKPVVLDTIGGARTAFRALGGPGSKSKPSRWRAELRVIVHDPALDDQDVLLAQLYKGRRKMGQPIVCDRVRELAQGTNPKFMLNYKIFAFKCEEKLRGAAGYKQMRQSKGAHLIKLSIKRVLQGKVDKDFATLRVNVLQLRKGAANNPYRAWGTDHDMKMPVSLAYEKPIGLSLGGRMPQELRRGTEAIYAAGGQYPTSLVIMSWFKYDKQRPQRATMTCFHNGKKIGWRPIDPLWSYKFEHWTYKGKKQVHSKWHQVRFELSRGGVMVRKVEGRTPNYSKPPHWIADNPGDYRCVAIQAGNIVKEFFFTVADGKLVAPTCQAASINTVRSVVLLPAKTKSTGDAKWSARAGKKYGFEGRAKWSRGCPPKKK